MRVRVVGAGVVGLSSAVLLAEAGHRVEVLTAQPPEATTSSVAAALWYPYRAHPRDRVIAWGARTYAVLVDLAVHSPEAGVRLRSGTELLRTAAADPWWAEAVPDLRRVRTVPDGWADGWTFTAPVVDMSAYLPWLQQRLVAAGGRVARRRLASLAEASTDGTADVLVHASGLGARELVGDDSLHPVRGQVVAVEQWGLTEWWLDGSGLTYVVPRQHEVVVGGSDEEGSEDLRIHDAQAEQIMSRAAGLVPELASARVLRHRVGLRPGRPVVRLEREERADGPPVVHCYGHGGAGVTLSWGCAEEVRSLVER